MTDEWRRGCRIVAQIERFADVDVVDALGFGEIGDTSADAQHSVERTLRELEARDFVFEQMPADGRHRDRGEQLRAS